MATWSDTAQENFEAASALRADRRWRSSASRAYYAAFALLTGRLIEGGQSPRRGFGTWPHEQLPLMVEKHLLSGAAASNVAYAVRRLYRLRLLADYQPLTSFDRSTAFEATGLMSQVFRQVK
jgi:uncharacterized protein (UPF0332 family)